MKTVVEPKLPPAGIEQVQLPQGRYLHDLSLFPLTTFRTYGKLNYEMVRLIYSMRDPLCYWAAAKGTKVLTVWDIGPSDSPDALTRKALAEIGAQADAIEGFFNVVILVKNPLLRGAVTGIKWLMGDKVPVNIAGDMHSSIKLARRRYVEAGLSFPDVPDDYEIPEWDEGRATLKVELSDIWWSLEDRGRSITDKALAAGR